MLELSRKKFRCIAIRMVILIMEIRALIVETLPQIVSRVTQIQWINKQLALKKSE
jgi:hypothetical protein